MAITKKPIKDVTAQNLYQVQASRGGNRIEWIVIHYLGVPNADNENLYGGGYGGHYYVSRAGQIYKAADPRTAVTWHCGGQRQGYDQGSAKYLGVCTNYNSIGIENGVCFDGTWYFTTETQESLVYLVSTLMDEYHIDIDHVIRHWDCTGKHCPAPYVENTKYKTNWTWDEFKAKLKAYRKGGSSNKITVDGMWGQKTTLLAQRVFSTDQDGIISNQWEGRKKYLQNCQPQSWEFVSEKKLKNGSALVKAIQRKIGAQIDGFFGDETAKKFQAWLGVTADGYIGPKTVMAFQRWLNSQV